jgi:hypothetical protein
MSNIQFGSGVVFAKATGGNLPVNPTPFRLGVLQEFNIDFKGDLKKLFGQAQFPVATARGKVEVSIKGKMATFDPNLLNQIMFAQVASVGVNQIADSEPHAIAATVTVTNAATFVNPGGDYGVVNATTGQPLIKVASAPAVGQYSVVESTGIYSFNATDVTSAFPVKISYLWLNATRGTTIALAGQLMGFAPELTILAYNLFRGKLFSVLLNDVTLGGISIPSKQEDFWITDIDGGGNLDAAGNLGAIYADNF